MRARLKRGRSDIVAGEAKDSHLLILFVVGEAKDRTPVVLLFCWVNFSFERVGNVIYIFFDVGIARDLAVLEWDNTLADSFRTFSFLAKNLTPAFVSRFLLGVISCISFVLMSID